MLAGKGFSDSGIASIMEEAASGKGKTAAKLAAYGGKGKTGAMPVANGSDKGAKPAGKGFGKGHASAGWTAKGIMESDTSGKPAVKDSGKRVAAVRQAATGSEGHPVAGWACKGGVSGGPAVKGSHAAAIPAAIGSAKGGTADKPLARASAKGGGKHAKPSAEDSAQAGAAAKPTAKASAKGRAVAAKQLCGKDPGKGALPDLPAAKGLGAAMLAAKGLGKGAASAILAAKGLGKGAIPAAKGVAAKSSEAGDPDKLLLWHDPEGAESAALDRELRSLNFSITRKRKIGDAAAFLKDSAKTRGKKWLVITSGENGEALVTAAHDERSVGAIIVRCSTADRHWQWPRRFNKVRKVTHDTSEVRSTAARMGNLMLIAREVQGMKRGAPDLMRSLNMLIPGVAAFSEQAGLEGGYALMDGGESGSAALVFRCIVGRLSKAPLPRDLKDAQLGRELEMCLKDRVAVEHWQDVWTADEWLADDGRSVAPQSLGQKLSLVYTSDYVYAKLNARLASADLGPIVNFLGAWCNDARRAPLHMRHLGPVLLRGFKRKSLDPEAYPDGSSCFWTAAASCSTKPSVAERFAGADGVVCHIARHPILKERHLDVDVGRNPDWSHYGKKEHEVLLFPYFHLRVKRKEKKGSRLWIYMEELPSVFLAKEKDIAGAIDHYVDGLLESRILSGGAAVQDMLGSQQARSLSGEAKKQAMLWCLGQCAAGAARIATMLLESSILSQFLDVGAAVQELQAAVGSESILAEAGGDAASFESLSEQIQKALSQSLRAVLKTHLV